MTIRYWPHFCEENIWYLCTDERVLHNGEPIPVEDRRVVFISNPRGRVAMREQRAGGLQPVLWDYHVVLLAGRTVWDLDTTLGFPVGLAEWVKGSFYPLRPDFAPRFRVIDAPTYLRTFGSDRSHMLGPGGVPMKPFPPWPRIGVGMTLPSFADMEEPFLGERFDLESFQNGPIGSR